MTLIQHQIHMEDTEALILLIVLTIHMVLEARINQIAQTTPMELD